MKRVLITGITSFIGRETAIEFLNRGFAVTGIVRKNSKNAQELPKGCEIIYMDVQDAIELPEKMPGGLDILVHFAWDGIGREGRMNPEIQQENIQNTLRLFQICQAMGCQRILFSGSQAEYGQTLERVRNLQEEGMEIPELSEESVCEPISLYGKAKLQILKQVSENDLLAEYVHMRIFSSYGANDHDTALTKIVIKACMRGEKLTLSPCIQLWNYIYIKDCARAIADLADCTLPEKNTVVNIAGEDTRVLKDFVLEIERCITGGNRGEILSFVEKEAAAEGTPYLNPSICKLKELTGFQEKITFREGIKEIERLYTLQIQN